MKPSDLQDIIDVLIPTFQAASSTHLDALTTFRGNLGGSQPRVGHEVVTPLKSAGIMTTRMLALSLMKHLTDMVRVKTSSFMETRTGNGRREGSSKWIGTNEWF